MNFITFYKNSNKNNAIVKINKLPIFCEYIQNIIVKFIDNINDLLAWKHICRYTFLNHSANFLCSKQYSMFNTPNIDLSRNNKNIKYDFPIIQLRCGPYVTSEFFTNQHELKTLICSQFNHLDDSVLFNNPKLEILCCYNNNSFTDNGLISIPNLIYLDCGTNNNFTDESIKKLTRLLCLDIHNNDKITDESIKHLTHLQHFIPNNNITMRSLQYLTKLTSLHNSYNNINMIRQNKNLKMLICNDLTLINNHIFHLTNLKILKCGPNTYFTDSIILRLTKLESLEFHTGKNKITDKSLKLLIDLKELSIINFLGYCENITDYSLKRLTNLQILYLYGHNNFTDCSLEKLSNLRELHCGDNYNFTNKSLSKLVKLNVLNCGSNINFTDEGLRYLTELKFIRWKFYGIFKFKYNDVLHIQYSHRYYLSLCFISAIVKHKSKTKTKLGFFQKIINYLVS
jgi:hypothetical protein